MSWTPADIKKLLHEERYQPVSQGRGATDSEISAAEFALRVSFPLSFKHFLREIGWVDSPYISVFGLGEDIHPLPNLTHMTLFWWFEVDEDIRLPRHLVPVVDDGSGNVNCLDVSKMQNSECPIVFWDHESFEGANQVPTLVGPDFCTWLVNEIRQLGLGS